MGQSNHDGIVDQAALLIRWRPRDAYERQAALAAVETALFGSSVSQSVFIDRYEVVRRLGSGGGGVVYLCRDPKLKRAVALKRLHVGGRDPQRTRARILREGSAMARLSHPNIVPLYDVISADGQLFLVQAFVEGEDLASWLQTPRPWRAIVERFVAAAAGLAAAHDVGLVHRDFKPSNVLVAADGRVLVADFGLARALEGTGSSVTELVPEAPGASSSGLAITASVVGTPAYMAPEQRTGSVDARADLYSFCVAMLEALCSPGRVLGTPRAAVLRVLERGRAVRREQRWPSMRALCRALVRASRPAGSRAAAATAVVGSVAIGAWLAIGPAEPSACDVARSALATAWNAERRDAVEASVRASEVPYAGAATQRVTSDLEAAAGRLARAHAQVCDGAEPAVRSERLACLRGQLDALQAAVEVAAGADNHVAEFAVGLGESLEDPQVCLGEAGPGTPPLDPSAAALRSRLALARALGLAGDPDRGYDQVAGVLQLALQSDDEVTEALALLEKGRLAMELGRLDEAHELLTEAVWRAPVLHLDELSAAAGIELLELVGARLRRFDEAEFWAGHARSAVARLREPGPLAWKLESAAGRFALKRGDFAAAQAGQRRALALLEASEIDRPVARAQVINNMGQVAHKGGDYAAAQDHYRRALTLRTKALGPSHPLVAASLNNVGSALQLQGRLEEGRPLVEQALALWRELLGPDHPSLAYALGNLGQIARESGQYEEALAYLERALEIRRAALGDSHPLVAYSHGMVAYALRGLTRIDDARMHLEAQRAILEPDADEAPLPLAQVCNNIADLLRYEGRETEALEYFERAIALTEQAHHAHPSALVMPLVGLGSSLTALGRPREALAKLDRAAILVQTRDVPGRWRGRLSFARAKALAAVGDTRQARAAAQTAQRVFRELGDGFAGAERDVQEWVEDHLR